MQSFKLINKANELYDYSFTYILNKMPGKAKTFRIALESERIRSKYQKEALVNLSTLDLIIGLVGKHKYIKTKRVRGFLGILNDTKKMMYGWIKEK